MDKLCYNSINKENIRRKLSMDINSILDEYTTSKGMFEEIQTLKLLDDKDSAKVKILVESQQDLINYIKPIHKIKVGKYDNDVACLGEDCPICNAGYNKRPVLVLPLFNIETNQVEFWKRGRKDIIKINALFEDGYDNLMDYTFKITRNGAKGSKDTTYTFNPLPKNEEVKDLESYLEDMPSIIGTSFKLILGLSPEQQVELLETGEIDWKKTTKGTEEEVPF